MATSALKIIISGAGQVGSGLAERLGPQGHKVTLIDTNSTLLSELDTHLDVMCLEGNGASATILQEAGASKADLYIGVSNSDECNLIGGALAKQMGTRISLIRVRNENYLLPTPDLYRQAMNLDLIINPDETAAQELYDLIINPVATNVADFASGRLKLIGMGITRDSPMAGKLLRNIAELKLGGKFLLACIIRNDEVIIPRGDAQIHVGDKAWVITTPDSYDSVNKLGGINNRTLKKVVLVGASRISYFLATKLKELGTKVVLIEKNQARAERFAEDLNETMILKGDGTDVVMLNEAGVNESDGFIAASQDDETNILAALLAKENGSRRVISVTRKPQYLPLMSHIKPIDIAINPRFSTLNAIMRYVEKGKSLSMTMLAGNRAEAFEVEVSEHSSLAHQELKSITFPSNVILGAIVRGDSVIIPSGDDHLLPDDHAIVIANVESVRKVDELFAGAKRNRGLMGLFNNGG